MSKMIKEEHETKSLYQGDTKSLYQGDTNFNIHILWSFSVHNEGEM